MTDTLRTDNDMLKVWRDDEKYDYAREMMLSDFNMGEWIAGHIDRMLSGLFGSRFYTDHETLIWTAIGIVFIAAIAIFIYRKHPGLFGRDSKVKTGYTVSEDTIYGIDFDAETTAAMQRKDYREAVRLTYLHCLKTLSDEGSIDWQPWKTPAQYVREAGMPEFQTFSNHFMRIRYGNFEATEELAVIMQQQRQVINGKSAQKSTIKKGGEPS